MIRKCTQILLAALLLGAFTAPAFAGIVVYEDKEKNKKVEIGARLQLQWLNIDPDEGEGVDTWFFRRLRPYIAGSVTKNWWGKFQFDFGKAEDSNEVAIKDAYMQYKGWDWGSIKIGNAKPGFSREFMTSSKKQQLVERSFVGDHNFGTPDRMLGGHLAGFGMDKKFEWMFSLGNSTHDPDLRRVDLDSPVNRSGDWNDAILVSGRLDWHPLGYLAKEQYDFKRETRFTVGLGAYSWANDDDRNTYTDEDGFCTSSSKCDLDTATGLEISAAFRGAGFAIDGEFQVIDAELIDGSVTKSLYVDGQTTLDKFALEGGWMFPSNKFEIVGGYESQDADGYADAWTRTSLGVNYFWNKEKAKVQLTYRIAENINGVTGQDSNQTFLQFQYVF